MTINESPVIESTGITSEIILSNTYNSYLIVSYKIRKKEKRKSLNYNIEQQRFEGLMDNAIIGISVNEERF